MCGQCWVQLDPSRRRSLPARPLAGVWPRVGAYLVDTVIVYVGVILASATLGFVSALLLPAYPAVLESDPFGWAAFLVIATAYYTRAARRW